MQAFLYKCSEPILVALHPSFFPSSPVVRRKAGEIINETNKKPPSCKRKPKEQIVSARAQTQWKALPVGTC